MSWTVFFIASLIMVSACSNDPSSKQLLRYEYAESTNGTFEVLTTESGRPVTFQEATMSLNSNLLRNLYLMDTITFISRERIPERFVHAAGAGAFGYFEVTHDISDICRAKLFSAVGKRTPIAVRFSLTAGTSGTSDTVRDIRGFAIKFYTEEGNLDIAGISSPGFSTKDPLLFPSIIHSFQRNPANNIIDPNTKWDILTQRRDNRIFVLTLLSDRGTPDGYRFLPGFGVHTFQVENIHGKPSFLRFHFIPYAGVKTLKADEAARLACEDPDYAKRDLYNAIENGNYPRWTVGIQILSLEDIKKATFDLFDVTKILPVDKYPIRPLGKFILDRNPLNYFAEIEQMAFCPNHLVPGILGAPDKLYEARILSYRDAQMYRLGVNFNNIYVNKPLNEPHNYNRGGRAPVKDNGKGAPNYFPNSFHGPIPYENTRSHLIKIIQDTSGNIEQARVYYNNYLIDEERKTLSGNIVKDLKRVLGFLRERVVKLFSEIDTDLGKRISEGLQKMYNTTHC